MYNTDAMDHERRSARLLAAGGRWVVLGLMAVGLLLAGCEPSLGAAGSTEEDVLNITVSIEPQRYFVERIGDGHVRVTVMVPPGANPATYEPRPEQMRALSNADAYMSIGVPFERVWMERIRAANPNMRIVDTAQGIERMPMGGGGSDNPDPHIWLSPRLVKVQIQTIARALGELDPAHKDEYEANRRDFAAEIDQLDARIRQVLAGAQGKKFMVFHPSWGYFARDYGLEMIPIEIEGKEPSAAELSALIRQAKEEGIKVIFAQPEFSTRSAETIAQEIGGRVVLVSPLAYDWPANMQKVADAFAQALAPSE